MKNAFFNLNGKDIDTLADKFIYPRTGIGRISDRLKEEIEKENSVLTNTKVSQIIHEGFTIKSVIARNCGQVYPIRKKPAYYKEIVYKNRISVIVAVSGGVYLLSNGVYTQSVIMLV